MRYTLSSILIAAMVIAAASVANCQSAGPTQKATGSISGHIIVEGKPAANIAVAAFNVDAKNPNVPRDGLMLTSGEHVSGLSVTITEGAAKLSGHISTGEGQSLSPLVRVYLAPAERDAAENILRFYEARPEVNGSFAFDDIAPGKYWIVMRSAEVSDQASMKSVRQDATLRAKIFQDAAALKKAVTLKPCEEIADLSLLYVAPASP